jgi:predicted ATPase/DNA-binding winged helix-turn-helix (wHTH) protein
MLVHESGAWELDLGRGELRGRGVLAPLTGRAFEIFAVLAAAEEELVGKDDLMGRVWPGAVVEENTLQAHISAIRKALGSDRELLKTVSGRGYRLVGAWIPREEKPVAQRAHRGPGFVARQPFRTNLPAATSDLVGRTSAAGHLLNVLSHHRVVTLTGAGGIGKTALAVEVGRRLFEDAQGDVYVVDLAPLSQPALVPSSIASVLDLRLGGADVGAGSVAQAIGERKLFLVLDNCEHLIEAAASAAEIIVQICPRVSLLATSREDLRIEAEYVYRVSPLSVPTDQDEDPDVILAQSSVQLFLAKMAAARSSFLPDRDALIDVGVICRRLDGIPLAIEFAAARAATLGVKQVAARLDDRFGLLTSGRRTAVPRHQTRHAALEWSYDLLPESERRLLRRTAVFPSGFTSEAAAAVLGDADLAPSSVVGGIANLVAKSLVTFDGPPSGGRWRLLETIRAYALEKLVEAGEADRAIRRSAEYLRDLFRPTAAASQGRKHPERNHSHREIDNVRAAIDWALSPSGDLAIGLELTANSAPLWFQLSLMTEFRERVEDALKLLLAMPETNDELEMRLQIAHGYGFWYTGPDAAPLAMEDAFRRALALAERVGDTDVHLQALWGTWAIERGRGDYRAALVKASAYESLANAASDRQSIILADRILALTHHDLGNQRLAHRHVENVLSRPPHRDPAASTDLQVDARVAMLALEARIQWLLGLPDQAMRSVREALDTALRMNHWFSTCYVLFIAGCPLSLWVGNLSEAQSRVDMLRERAGGKWQDRYARIYGSILRLRQGSERDVLTAAYIEPRVQYAMLAALAELTSASTIPVPFPDDLPYDAPWSLPEVLRVDADLLLWRGGPDAVSAAETKLRRSLELAREQSAQSWELRSAVSFARLRIMQGRRSDAREILAPVYGKFTEGFETLDLRSARVILQSLTAGGDDLD